MWWFPWSRTAPNEKTPKADENPTFSTMNRDSFKDLLMNSSMYNGLKDEVKTDFLLELYQTFKRFDQDGDGRISASELANVLSSCGSAPSSEEVKMMIDNFDTDKDGCLDFDEFVKLNLLAVTLPTKLVGGDEVDALFTAFDQNGNGLICAEELFRMMNTIGEEVTFEECMEMIERADMNGDGHVDVIEFRRLMALPHHEMYSKSK